ncbi:MAG: hypothetical protein HZT41_15265 [Dechloromonas sp.]|nr:MAG: hypothetical protein HZT41_15265 [Dechloromonas sp.]
MAAHRLRADEPGGAPGVRPAPALRVRLRHPRVAALQVEDAAHVAGAQPDGTVGRDEGMDLVPGEAVAQFAGLREIRPARKDSRISQRMARKAPIPAMKTGTSTSSERPSSGPKTTTTYRNIASRTGAGLV